MSPDLWRRPYRREGSAFWWARLPVAEGANRERSLGVRDPKQARTAVTVLGECYNGPFRERGLVFAVARGELTVAQFMEAHNRRELPALAHRLENPDVDLNTHVSEWQAWLRGRANTTDQTRAKYLYQVRCLMPEGIPFPASRFTRRTISVFLAGLTLGAPNRYKAALSSFGKYLVEREVLETNAVRDVQGAKEAAPRVRFLSRPEAQKLIGAIETEEARTIHALMCGSGMEVSSVLSLRRRDIDLKENTVHAHGTKRLHRDRTLKVTEPWCWQRLVDYVNRQRGLPDAKVFQISYWRVRDAIQRATKAVGIENYRTHDWRHTYAVQARRDGLRDEVIAHQLGNKTTAMVQNVYGRYTPSASDYQTRQTLGLTDSSEGSTTTRRRRALA